MRAGLAALRALIGGGQPPARPLARIGTLPPGPVWAVGDIHGQSALLDRLEAAILRQDGGGRAPVRILYLGDYVDRGPDSAGVLDRFTAPAPPGIERHFLCGNHEEMFAHFLSDPQPGAEWLQYGGRETLASYGLFADRLGQRRHLAAAVESLIPHSHRIFLEGLFDALRLPCPSLPGGEVVFVHAGIDPQRALCDQPVRALRWMREPFLSAPRPAGPMVIHGHTPVDALRAGPTRINVDTGAGQGGALSAVRLGPQGQIAFMQVFPQGQVSSCPDRPGAQRESAA